MGRRSELSEQISYGGGGSDDEEGVQLPVRFELRRGGSNFMLAHAVAKWLGITVADLFRRYPSLYRRQATLVERVELIRRGLCKDSAVVSLVKADQIDMIDNKEDEDLLETKMVTEAASQALPKNDAPSSSGIAFIDCSPQVKFAECQYEGARIPDPTLLQRHSVPRNPFGRNFRLMGFRAALSEWPENKLVRDGCTPAQKDALVPVVLDFEANGNRLQEAFLWNVHEEAMSLTDFLCMLCDENEVPKTEETMMALREQMELQISTKGGAIRLAQRFYRDHVTSKPSHGCNGDDGGINGTFIHNNNTTAPTTPMQDSDCASSAGETAAISSENNVNKHERALTLHNGNRTAKRRYSGKDVASETVNHMHRASPARNVAGESNNNATKTARAAAQAREMLRDETDAVQLGTRVPIKISVVIGGLELTDQFEWDLIEDNNPEWFAQVLCRDLGIGGEFAGIIAHSIRDQVVEYLRIMYQAYENSQEELQGLSKAAVFEVAQKEAIASVSPNVMPVLKGQPLRGEGEADIWCPSFKPMDQAEASKGAHSREREARRLRREANFLQSGGRRGLRPGRRKAGSYMAKSAMSTPLGGSTPHSSSTSINMQLEEEPTREETPHILDTIHTERQVRPPLVMGKAAGWLADRPHVCDITVSYTSQYQIRRY